MKKILATMLSVIACLLLLVGCNNTSNNDTPNTPDNEQSIKTYTVDVRYVYRDTVIYSLSDTKKEGEAYNYSKYDNSIPDTYIKNEDKDSYFPDDYAKGTIGYNTGVLTCTYQVKPKYEQYMQITTTNANTNGSIIPFSVLGRNIGNNPYTVNDYNNEPVTFRLSEITEIKLFNTYSFYNNRLVDYGNGITNNFGTIHQANNNALNNLVKVDMSECTFIEELPSNFFSGIQSLKTVITNGNTKKLRSIGSDFLSNSENIEFIDFDFSSLDNVGQRFLTNALINYKDELTVNLSTIKESGWLFMYQWSESNIPTINIILGNTQWQNHWLVGMPNDPEYGGKYYHSSVNLNIYTNYKGNVETSLQGFIVAGINVHIYDMPNQN